MPAGTAKSNLKATAAQCLIDIRVSSGSIDYEQRADCVAPWRGRKEMPHAAKIAFAFLTHIADEKYVGCRFELRLLQCIGDSQERSESGCVVTDPWTVKLVRLFAGLQRSALRKNGIEMRADAYERRIRPVVQKSQYVAQFVLMHVLRAERDNLLPEPFTARRFAKRGRRDFSKLTLPATKFHLLVVQVCKSSMNAPHLRDAGYLSLGGNSRAVRNGRAAGHL